MLTLHQLEVFVTVARHLSMRAAADELTVSQPAVSASVAALQKEVGVDLFAKKGRGIELTDDGATMLRYSRRVLELLDEGLTATRSGGAGSLLALRLGLSGSAAAHLVTPWMAQLHTSEEVIEFTLEVANRSMTWRALAEGEVDVAITSRPPASATFRVLATYANEFVLVARPGLVWAGKLGEVTWLLREEGSTTRAAAEEVMARLDITPPHMVIGANAAIQSSVEAGLGVGLLPTAAVREGVRLRHLIVIRTPATPVRRPWHVIVRDEEALSPVVPHFLAAVAGIDPALRLTPEGFEAIAEANEAVLDA